MKTLLALALVLFALVLPASAVTWDVVSVSMIVKLGSSGNVTTTVLNNSKFLTFVANANSVPKSDLFIGIREDTGDLAVVQRSTKTVLFGIVTSLSVSGIASNGTGTGKTLSGPATISSFNTNFSGYFYETQTRKANATIKSINRQVIGGNGIQTIKGTFVTTGTKFNL